MPTEHEPVPTPTSRRTRPPRKEDTGEWLFWLIGLLVLVMMAATVG